MDNLEGKSRFFKKLISFLGIVAILGGIYYAYTTGELLNLLNWLVSQDPLLLIGIAVLGLIAIAMLLGG